jgi:hypothetical protein
MVNFQFLMFLYFVIAIHKTISLFTRKFEILLQLEEIAESKNRESYLGTYRMYVRFSSRRQCQVVQKFQESVSAEEQICWANLFPPNAVAKISGNHKIYKA